jgi:hypothetical protein
MSRPKNTPLLIGLAVSAALACGAAAWAWSAWAAALAAQGGA